MEKYGSVTGSQSIRAGCDEDNSLDEVSREPAKNTSEDEERSEASAGPAPDGLKGEDETDIDQQTPTAAGYVHCSLASAFG